MSLYQFMRSPIKLPLEDHVNSQTFGCVIHLTFMNTFSVPRVTFFDASEVRKYVGRLASALLGQMEEARQSDKTHTSV